MTTRLTPATALLMTVPPFLWAGNVIVASMLQHQVPPILLNYLRWMLALLILVPMAGWVLRARSGMWAHWKYFALLGFFGIGNYNTLQYVALETSSPLNVTLVAASLPLWMLAVGALFFHARVTRKQVLGAILSMVGVAVVLSRGRWEVLAQLHLVPGDIFTLGAAASWAVYSWLLAETGVPGTIRGNWAAFLLAQLVFGVVWSGAYAGVEWAVTDAKLVWGWPLVAGLLFIAIGPAVLAYRCWGLGIQRAGPAIAAFFSNLTPLFAALMSAAFLGDPPRLFHAVAFVLIASGILVSSRR
ncbi:MAG: DMT family transporter [Burkholderiaceae bacterium]